MRKVEHYICEVCGTEYKDKALCEKCERLHKQGLTIVRARQIWDARDYRGGSQGRERDQESDLQAVGRRKEG